MKRIVLAPIAATAVLAAAAIGFVVGSAVGDGHDARFAVEVASMAGVESVTLDGAAVSGVSFRRDTDPEEILAVRDRLEDRGEDASIDVAGVHGRWSDLEAVAPAMVAVARVGLEPASVRLRDVSGGVWIEARMVDDTTPADAASVVLRLLREFAVSGLPADVQVIGANTRGEQLDLVMVSGGALTDLDRTVTSLEEVLRQTPAGRIECADDGCAAAPTP